MPTATEPFLTVAELRQAKGLAPELSITAVAGVEATPISAVEPRPEAASTAAAETSN